MAGDVSEMSAEELNNGPAYNGTYNGTVQVPCREMGAMMDDASFGAEEGAGTFLSLDVEGAEPKVRARAPRAANVAQPEKRTSARPHAPL